MKVVVIGFVQLNLLQSCKVDFCSLNKLCCRSFHLWGIHSLEKYSLIYIMAHTDTLLYMSIFSALMFGDFRRLQWAASTWKQCKSSVGSWQQGQVQILHSLKYNVKYNRSTKKFSRNVILSTYFICSNLSILFYLQVATRINLGKQLKSAVWSFHLRSHL